MLAITAMAPQFAFISVFYTSWKGATPPWRNSHGRYGQVRLV